MERDSETFNRKNRALLPPRETQRRRGF